MGSTNNTQFEGWLGLDRDAVKGNMQWGQFEPKKWQEDDVDIEIECCGICGSDLHTLSSGWAETPYPCVVGHEIVGRAIRIGSNVTNISIGDRVGVGAQARSCKRNDCHECSTSQENYCCNSSISTYGSTYPNGEGLSYGGFAKYNRTDSRFVIKIPEALSSADAAPMLCGGITVFSPLKRNGCAGKRVGIVGIGGLGHFAILFARALGADYVVGISRKPEKRKDALELGADKYIATDEKDWAANNRRSLDLIISTVNSPKMPLTEYLSMLAVHGTYIQVGAPDKGELPPINAFTLIANCIKVGGAGIGSPSEISEMLQLAVDHNIKPWIQKRPMAEANQAIIDQGAGKARYRYVLEN